MGGRILPSEGKQPWPSPASTLSGQVCFDQYRLYGFAGTPGLYPIPLPEKKRPAQVRHSILRDHTLLRQNSFDTVALDSDVSHEVMWLDAYVMLIVTHRFPAPRPMGLTLAGADVGMIPFCYADQWVKKGHLVPLAPEKFRIVSMLHAVRLYQTGQNDAAERLW
jgi:hypothetical protein